jgi:hypothetical protein
MLAWAQSQRRALQSTLAAGLRGSSSLHLPIIPARCCVTPHEARDAARVAIGLKVAELQALLKSNR